ncbi:hypothetical protein HK101_000185 [Irineochytrium annulatum]|nr:hypothetical protein HK101_000185 [Irineochytrium annulatum]
MFACCGRKRSRVDPSDGPGRKLADADIQTDPVHMLGDEPATPGAILSQLQSLTARVSAGEAAALAGRDEAAALALAAREDAARLLEQVAALSMPRASDEREGGALEMMRVEFEKVRIEQLAMLLGERVQVERALLAQRLEIERARLEMDQRALGRRVRRFEKRIGNSVPRLAITGAGDEVKVDEIMAEKLVFISYCWRNSKEQMELDYMNGLRDADAIAEAGPFEPRRLLDALKNAGFQPWLDVDRLQAGKLLPEQIAEALSKAVVVIANISDEYANSAMCVREFNFAMNHDIPIIPVIVGITPEERKRRLEEDGDKGGEKKQNMLKPWSSTGVGFYVGSDLYIDARNAGDADSKIRSIVDSVTAHVHRRALASRATPISSAESVNTLEEAIQLNSVEAVKRLLTTSSRAHMQGMSRMKKSASSAGDDDSHDGRKKSDAGGKETPRGLLHMAVAMGNTKVVEMMLKEGMDVNGADENGVAPLWKAKTAMMVKLLLEHKADVGMKRANGESIMHHFAQAKTEEVAAILKMLLTYGADLHARDRFQNTPLMRACMSSNTQGLRALILAGARTEDTNAEGWTLPHFAVNKGDATLLHALITFKIPLDLPSTDGRTPAFMAVQQDELDIVRILLDRVPDSLLAADRGGRNVLHIAAFTRNLPMLEFLHPVMARRNITLDAPDHDGWTCLHYAVSKGEIPMLSHLLSHGASIDHRTNSGQTLLLTACVHRKLACLEHLLPLVSPEHLVACNNDGWNCIHAASRFGSLEMLQLLIASGAPLAARTHTGQTALHVAVGNERARDVVAHLIPLMPIDLGVDARNNEGWTVAHVAARLGAVDVMELLIDSGAALDALTNTGNNLYHIACSNDKLDVLQFLVPRMSQKITFADVDGQGWSCVHFAAYGGSVRMLKVLVEAGESLRKRTADGKTLLHIAAAGGRMRVMEFLVEQCPEDLGAVTNKGWTAQHFAVQHGSLEVLAYLIALSVPLGVTTSDGLNLLHVACFRNRLEVLRYLCGLMPESVTVDSPVNRGWTCIHFAVDKGDVEMLDFLIDRGARLDILLKEKRNILHFASQQNRPAMLTRLLEIMPARLPDVTVNTPDAHGQTSLHLAVSHGHLPCIEILVAAGASPAAETHDGRNALHVACENDKLLALKTLIAAGLPGGVSVRTRRKSDGWSCIFFAAHKGSVEIVAYLVSRKESLAGVDAHGRNLLEIACGAGSIAMVRWLRGRVPDTITLTTRDKLGESCLFHAVRGGSVDVVAYVLEHGGSVHERNKAGETVIHVAAGGKHVEVFRLLMAQLASGSRHELDDVDYAGLNAALHAVKGGSKPTLELILARAPGSLEHTTLDGRNAFHVASCSGHLEMLQHVHPLIQKWDFESTDNRGWTCLHHAIRLASRKLVRYLILQRGKNAIAVLHDSANLIALAPKEDAEFCAWLGRVASGEEELTKASRKVSRNGSLGGENEARDQQKDEYNTLGRGQFPSKAASSSVPPGQHEPRLSFVEYGDLKNQ